MRLACAQCAPDAHAPHAWAWCRAPAYHERSRATARVGPRPAPPLDAHVRVSSSCRRGWPRPPPYARGPAGSAACGGCRGRRSCAVIRPRCGRKSRPATRWAACRRLLMCGALVVRGSGVRRKRWCCHLMATIPSAGLGHAPSRAPRRRVRAY